MAYDAHPPAETSMAKLVLRLGVKLRFAKDQEIFAQSDAADLLYLVVSGAVRTMRLFGDGRRQIAAFYFPGELIGPEAGAVQRFAAEALDETVVVAVRLSTLDAVAGGPELERAIWQATRRELERVQEHLLVLGRKSAAERVASFLLTLARRTPGLHVSVPMSRQDIADYLGLSIETVSRMLTQLQAAEVVEFESFRRFAVRRWEALQQIAA